MIDTIYIEREVLAHPRTQSILARFPQAHQIVCERYGEVFNRRAQDFRAQKQHPSLILARKHDGFVLPAPEAYGIGGSQNYYFSHMMNCIYDCRYCFLQGMYRSAHYVLFVNYEDFFTHIEDAAKQQDNSYFFSGYDCDSLALEPVSGFIDAALPVFEKLPQHFLELRTKSTQVRNLLRRDPIPNVIAAFSLSPQKVVDKLEAKTPSLQKRLDALQKLQQAGWKIGLRFDPVIIYQGYQQDYLDLFEQVFQRLSLNGLHSVSLGGFRMPESFFNNMLRLYPQEPLFAIPMQHSEGMIAFQRQKEEEMMTFCKQQLLGYIPEDIFFPCHH